MADSKKYNGSTWEHSLRKLTTATDTITTLPVDIYADGTNATVGLKGNTVQNGTPSPDNPIMPQGTGERTGNLLDNVLVSTTNDGVTVTLNPDKSITVNGTLETASQALFKIGTVLFENGESYTISGVTGYTSITMQMFTESTTAFPRENRLQCFDGAITRTALGDEICDVNLYVYGGAVFDNVKIYPFICKGSTLLPYEPYGYKIPISSASTTTPVYLGEVETTRKIKKLVLTGKENITRYAVTQGSLFRYVTSDGTIGQQIYNNALCTHYVVTTVDERADNTLSGNASASNTNLDFIDNRYNSAADFKSYLAAQYANGTPVTVWHVLAEPETGIVNEPLMKIGDYADTVSGITVLPTITGKDTFDVETTLKPSEASLSYTGWHDATVKEWDGSQWNE